MSSRMAESFAQRAIDRSTTRRRTDHVLELERLVAATYDVIERTGSVDPSMRDILQAARCSTHAFYRLLESKDELMLLVLDDGAQQLLGYLEHRMAGAADPPARVRAWITGMLAQATDPDAAARTRPFVVNSARLAELHPAQQQASVDRLVDQLGAVVRELGDRTPRAARRDAEVLYRLALGAMHDHVLHRTRPTAAEVDHLVAFALRGLDAPSSVHGSPRR